MILHNRLKGILDPARRRNKSGRLVPLSSAEEASSRETQGEVGPSILDLVRFGLPDDYCETYASKVRALKVSDLEDAAKTVIHPDDLIWVIVDDSSKIEADVRELNLGEFHRLSAEGHPL